MPTKRSQFSRYVIPDNLDPEGICCVSVPVPDDPQWRAQFLGALWRVTLQSHYERDPDQNGKVIAARWRTVYEEVRDSMGTCTPSDSIIRATIIANFRMQLQIEFTANGLDGIAPDRPDTFWDEDTGDAGDEILQRENALCNACIDYVNTVADDLAGKITTAGLTGIPIITPIVMSIAPVAGAIFVGALTILTELTIAAINDPEIRRVVACCMYDNLKGVAITEANFNASLTGCGFPALSDEEIVRDMLEAGVNDTANYLAFVNVLGSHFASVGVEQVDCSCGLWTHTFDFEGADDHDWTDRAEDARPFGVFVPGQGWVSEWAFLAGTWDDLLYLQRKFDARTVIAVHVFYTTTGVVGGSSRDIALLLKLAGVNQDVVTYGVYDVPGVFVKSWSGSETVDEIETSITSDTPSDVSEFTVTKIIVTGEGTDPFL